MAYNETDRGAKYAESAHYQADPRTWADNAAKEVESNLENTATGVFNPCSGLSRSSNHV
ncbi:hypothetical protein HMPREF0578_1220 [Mobiluncus mulieris 28-1]|nr:hypothetical protein HMPREF0578_1220 [Mobiluncus mulieris 28-1]